MSGLYVHIPFCASRCAYCGFYSTTLLPLRPRYVAALCREMRLRPLADGRVETVYLGGGTPSVLGADGLRRVVDYIYKVYDVAPGAEVTVECNPDDVCPAGFSLPPQVNRVSMGAQTFSDERLRFLGRRHTAAQVETAVARLRAMGIANISVDLMFGFPGETVAEWQADVERVLALGVEHVSAYSLMYEEGTALYRLLERGEVAEVDEEVYRQMYALLVERLTSAGYDHYEISNFARPGRRSRHNSSYWQAVPYLGIGAAAHSYTGAERSWNVADLHKYMDSIERGILPSEREQTDGHTRYNDLIATALRTREGLPLAALSADERRYMLAQAAPHLAAGRLRLTDTHLALTMEGIYVSDDVMTDLILE